MVAIQDHHACVRGDGGIESQTAHTAFWESLLGDQGTEGAVGVATKEDAGFV